MSGYDLVVKFVSRYDLGPPFGYQNDVRLGQAIHA